VLLCSGEGGVSFTLTPPASEDRGEPAVGFLTPTEGQPTAAKTPLCSEEKQFVP